MTIETLGETRLPPGEARAASLLRWHRAAGKRFFVLSQRGRLADIAHDHGRLLAPEIEAGVFPEILATIAAGTDTPSDKGDRVLGAMFAQLTEDVFSACGDDFRAAVEALSEGYQAGIAAPRFSRDDVIAACVAIDTGNIATGIERLIKRPLHPRVAGIIEYIVRAVRNQPAAGATVADPQSAARELVREMGVRGRAGMGCTGFFAAPAATDDGRGLHARTFDGAFFDWNAAPGLFITDEREADPAFRRYVSVGTAGLIYPGGISGMNDAGIACSLHQMSSVLWSDGRKGRGWEIAPFVQQRILREARTLDEAVDLAMSTRHFAAWTILVSDAATGRALRVEINGRSDSIGRYIGRVEASDAAPSMVQTNHFLARALAETHDYFEDAHFTKTVGKWLETRARATVVGAALDAAGQGGVTTDLAQSHLAGHADGALGGRRRAFGRTVCKAYGLMASIARCDPDRTRARDEIWFTIGERLPGPHASFAGFAVDWTGLDLRPVADRPLRRPETVDPDHLRAMEAYVEAFRAMERPRDPSGKLLTRAPTMAERAAARAEALGHLDRAILLAEDAGIIEPGFRHVRARLRHEAGMFAEAAEDWANLQFLIDNPVAHAPVHDWEAAIALILSAATEDALGREGARDALLERGLGFLQKVRRAHFRDTRPHQGLADWEKVAAAIRADGAGAELPAIDFVTVE